MLTADAAETDSVITRALRMSFDAVVRSNNPWVKHGLPALLAVLVYGLGLGYLARYSAART